VAYKFLRGQGSSHVAAAAAGEVQGLDADAAVAFEAEETHGGGRPGRQEGNGQVEEAVAEAHGGHQAADGGC